MSDAGTICSLTKALIAGVATLGFMVLPIAFLFHGHSPIAALSFTVCAGYLVWLLRATIRYSEFADD